MTRDQRGDAGQLGRAWRRSSSGLPALSAGPEGGGGQPRHLPGIRGRPTLMRLRARRPSMAAVQRASAPTASPAIDALLARRCQHGPADAASRAAAGRAPRSSLTQRRRPASVQRTPAVVPAEDLAAARQRQRCRCACRTASARSSRKDRDLFDGIKPYVARSGDRGALLLIGPFRGPPTRRSSPTILRRVGVDAFECDQFPIRQDCATRYRMSLPPAIAAHPAQIARPAPSRKHDPARAGRATSSSATATGIIHSVAFRRLRHKTQVFVAPDGDHYRVRLTHSLEVAQIGRTIARALGLNEDLTEALCLAHDLGHPPFGHAGEDALSAALADAGGFDHNAHTLRLVTRLETPYPDFDGLNLSWEALEGLAKHNGPVTDAELGDGRGQCANGISSSAAGRASRRRSRRSPTTSPTTITTSTTACAPGCSTSTSWSSCRSSGGCGRRSASAIPDLPLEKRQRALVRDMIGTMVGDVLAETERRRARSGRRDDRRRARRRAGRWPASPTRSPTRSASSSASSTPGSTIFAELKPVREEAERVVANLAAAYRADPALLPDRLAARRRRDRSSCAPSATSSPA